VYSPFVSIIIPTYNRSNSIVYTLNSFLKQDYPNDKYEVIVCDNNSTDNTKTLVHKYIKKYGENKIKYMFEGRQGVHYARNSAAMAAKGETLYFTDDDMLAESDLLKELVPIFEYDSNIGCATGRVLPKWEKEPPKWIKKHCNNYLLSLNDLGLGNKIGNYDMGVFSCHEAIRREAFWETGGFHPEYTKEVYLGDGETGLNQDIIGNGWLMAYVGKSTIYHMIPPKRMTQKHINKVMGNVGRADSYREYREGAFVKSDLSLRRKEYLKYYLINCLVHIIKSMLGKSSLRFIVAGACYCRARIEYDARVVNDEKFRKIVTTNDWLNRSLDSGTDKEALLRGK